MIVCVSGEYIANEEPLRGGFFLIVNLIYSSSSQGDWLETKLNSYVCVSTMAAAGLGNTISDVFGIQTAVYVEQFTEYLGFKAPPLTQFQFDMKCSKRAANLVSGGSMDGWID